MPELLTWHLGKAVALRVTSGDQGTEEMPGAFRLWWVSSQCPAFLCSSQLVTPLVTAPLLIPTFLGPVVPQLGCAEGLDTTALPTAWRVGRSDAGRAGNTESRDGNTEILKAEILLLTTTELKQLNW